MNKYVILFLLFSIYSAFAQVTPKNEWWLKEPYRLVQTNLREIDAIDFDIDVYLESVKEIGANTVLINVGGIVANYYTKLTFHYKNPYLKNNLLKEVVDRLHQENIRVIGRYDFSKLNEKYAFENPDWLYKSVDGEYVNYNGQVHTCVNGGYQQEYALKILNESLTMLPLDGVFFNMIGYRTRDYSHNYHGICQSIKCSERFEAWSGGLKLPIREDMEDSVFRKYQQFKDVTKDELFNRIQETIKSHGNHIAICTYTHAGTDLYRKESNSHSSLNSGAPAWEYSASHNVKSTIGSWKNKQASNTAVHFYSYPARHAADASWLTQKRLFQNMMHGAGLDFYCIGRLDNLEDRHVLGNVKKVFQFHKKHENFFHHTQSGNKILLVREGLSSDEYEGVFEILTENHVLFDVMEHFSLASDEMPKSLNDYEIVILPDVARLSERQCKFLDQYVEAGGRLMVTGLTSTKDEIGNPLNQLRLKSLGAAEEYKPYEKTMGVYYRITDEDKKVFTDSVYKYFDLVYAWEKGLLPTLKENATGHLGYIPQAMFGPPEKCYYEEVTDIPGLINHQYGKGETVFITFRLGAIYQKTSHYGHAALIMTALNQFLDYSPELVVEASPLVEISRQIDSEENFEWYALLNHTGQMGSGFFAPEPIRQIDLRFKPVKPVKNIKSLLTDNPLEFKENGDWIELKVDELNAFDVMLVQYAD